jgi:hypothetical protein
MEAETVREPMVELHDIYCLCERCVERRESEKVLRETK